VNTHGESRTRHKVDGDERERQPKKNKKNVEMWQQSKQKGAARARQGSSSPTAALRMGTHLVTMEAQRKLAQGHVALRPDEGLETLLLDRDVAMLENARDVGWSLVTEGLNWGELSVPGQRVGVVLGGVHNGVAAYRETERERERGREGWW